MRAGICPNYERLELKTLGYNQIQPMPAMDDTGIPGVDEIVQESMAKIPKEDPDMLTPETVPNWLSDTVEVVFGATDDAYRNHERGRIESYKKGLTEGLPEMVPRKRAEKIVCEAVDGIRDLRKSLEQSRASRADKTLERIVQELLTIAGIPSEVVARGDKKYNLDRIGLVIPDRQTAVNNPDKVHFLSFKTSLSEHWKQAVEEHRPGQKTHLITVLQGETLGNEVAKDIVRHGIFLYLPDSVKEDRFPDEPRIRKLSDLPFAVGGEYVDKARAPDQ